MRFRSLVGSLLLGLIAFRGPLALATEYSVELAPQKSKEAAESQLGKAPPEGAHVVRRYVRDTGWAWFVVIDGLGELDAARAAAGQLASAEAPATIYEKNGRELKELEIVSAPAPAASAPKDEEGRERRRRGADEGAEQVLDAAVRAHGGRGAGLEQLAEAGTLRFSYDRTVPADGAEIIARNLYVRQGQSLRLDVTITKGTGEDSVTVVRPDGVAWVVVDGQKTDRDAGRVREVLARFSPETVLAVPLGLPDDVETAEVWRELRLVGNAVEDGGNRQVLAPAEPARGGLVSAAFDPTDHTLRRVTWSAEAGQLTFRYDDYRRLDRHLVVPFHARVERDGVLIEEVFIQELTLDPTLDPNLFAAPGNPG